MPITVGDAVVKFIGDRSKLNQDLNQSEKDTKAWAERTSGGIKGAFGKIFSVAGGILAAGAIQKVGGAVVGMFKGAIDYGGDATETMGKFGVTFGDAADALEQRLAGFSAEAGRSRHDLIGMAADFGAVLKGMSLTSDMAAEYSGNLAELAVDVGSFMNAQAPEVMDKFRAAMTGEYESLKSLGIVINQAAVEQELLNMGLQGGAKAATEAQLVQARYNLLLQKTKDAQGDAIRTSDSWANTQVRLGGIWRDFLTDVGMGTTTALAPMMGTVANLASDVLPRLAGALTGTVLPALGGLVTKGIGAAQGLGDLIARFRETSELSGGGVQGALAGLGTVLQGLVPPGVAEQIQGVVQTVSGFVDTLMGIGQRLAGGDLTALFDLAGLFAGLRSQLTTGLFDLGQQLLTSLATAFPDLAPFIETFLRPILNIGQQLYEAGMTIQSTLTSVLFGAFQQIGPQLVGALPDIAGILQTALGGAISIVQTVLGDILPFIQSFAADAATFLVTEFGGIVDWFTENLPLIQQTVETVLTAIEAVWTAVWPVLETALSAIWENIKILVSGAMDAILGFITAGMLLINGDWDGALQELQTVAEGILQTIQDVFLNTLGAIVSIILDKKDDFIGAGEDLVNGLIEGVKAKAGEVIAAAKKVVEDAIAAVNRLLDRGSPSKVFMEMGFDMMLGMALGIDEGEQKAVDALTRSLQSIVNLVSSATSAMTGMGAATEGPMPDLETFGARLFATVMRIIDVVQHVRRAIKDEQLKEDAGIVPMLTSLLGLAKTGGVEAMRAMAESEWFDMETWGARLFALIKRIIEVLQTIRGWIGNEGLAAAVSITEHLGKLTFLVGVSGIKAVQEMVAAEWPDLELWGQRLAALFVRVIEVLQFLRGWISNEGLEAAVSIAEYLGKLTFLIGVQGIKSVQEMVEAKWPDLELWGQRLAALFVRVVEVLQFIRGWISDEGIEAAAGIVDHVKKIIELLAVSIAVHLPDLTTWRHDVQVFAVLLRWAGQQLLSSLNQLGDEWREAEMPATKAADNLQKVVGLLRTALDVQLPKLEIWRWSVQVFGGLLRWAGEQLLTEINKLSEDWFDAEMAAAKAADNLHKIAGLLGINLAVTLPRLDMRGAIAAFIEQIKLVGPLLRDGIDTLRAEFTAMRNGVEEDLLPEAAEASGLLQEVFGFLNLLNLFEKLQTQKKLQPGEYRTALSNVIANFITELKNSTPILQKGLAEVEEMWDELLDSYLGEGGIIAKIKELFEGLGAAIQSAVSIGAAEISTTDILRNLRALYSAISQINNLPPPSLPELPAPTAQQTGQGTGGDMLTLADIIAQKIQEAIISGYGVLEVHLSPDLRAEFSNRIQNLEIQVRDMSNQLAARGAG